MSPAKLRIVVLGYIVRAGLAGHAWHHLHYVAGLAQLGHDVWFIEEGDEFPSCYDPNADGVGIDPSYGLSFAAAAFDSVQMGDRWAYYDAHSQLWLGPARLIAPEVCRTADVVLNLSGSGSLRDGLSEVPVRALIDTDPAFTQALNVRDAEAQALAEQHTRFFTFAENVGKGAILSDDGFDWLPTRQPVVLDLWSAVSAPADGSFTTVMLWDSYGTVEANGIELGMKSQSFDPYLDLPAHLNEKLELALGSRRAPRELLTSHGWIIIDPRIPTRSLDTYRKYIIDSRGEFSVAKHGYVVADTGWFSERSANYLATGRPVIAQDTGFSRNLPTGTGLLPFSSPDEAIAAIKEASGSYETHCKAARAIAEECFDSRIVLRQLLERV